MISDILGCLILKKSWIFKAVFKCNAVTPHKCVNNVNFDWSCFCSEANENLGSKVTHHADFKGIEQVKGQCSHQVDNEPRGQVVDADLPGVENYLARLADITGAKIKNDIWREQRETEQTLQSNPSHKNMSNVFD